MHQPEQGQPEIMRRQDRQHQQDILDPLVRAHEFNQGHWVLLHTVLLALFNY